MAIQSLENDGNGQARFPGCSHIRDYEFFGKLGEGTFGWVTLESNFREMTDRLVVKCTKPDLRRTIWSSL